jgi:DNA-binding MurR/RpiR family transcriptional regulator
MIPGAGETVAERIADLGKGDVVLVVGVRRMVGILKRYMKAISKTGASVLLITDPSVREIPAFARWTITCPVENPHVFDSYAGVLAVIRLLAYETFRRAGKPGRDYMQKIEAQHEELAEFE